MPASSTTCCVPSFGFQCAISPYYANIIAIVRASPYTHSSITNPSANELTKRISSSVLSSSRSFRPSMAFHIIIIPHLPNNPKFIRLWYNFYTMPFEYNPRKSRLNREKHGIDFKEAQALWKDENRLEIPARTVDELRSLLIGQINGIMWSAIITYRDENIRIISVRRSRKEEVELYESL